MNIHVLQAATATRAGDAAEPATLPECASATVARLPTQPVIRIDSCALTYADLWSQAQQVAGGLAASGIRPGDAVGVALPQGDERLMAELAITLLGASFASLDWPADAAEAVAALVPLAPLLIIVPRRSTLARLDIPLIDLQTLKIRDDRVPRPPAGIGLDPATMAQLRPRRNGRDQPLGLSHATLLAQLQATAATTPRKADNSFMTATAQERLDGCDPGWLALVTGATWQIGPTHEPRPPRPFWQSVKHRLGRG